MLNGIGGRTIEEAKERLSHAEFVSWCAYIQKRGPLDIGSRIEHGFAMLAYVTTASMGGKKKFEDFLPKRDQEEQKPASIDDVFSLIKDRAKGVK